jgi:anti-sigma B factor antagonist
MPTTNLTMTVRKRDEGVSVIDIVGEITSFADADITAAHEKTSAESPKAVVLNFTGLDYMNSGGIGLLVTTLIRAQRSGHQLLAYGLTEHYAQIFALTRLNEAIGIFEDEESAVASVA